jgi:hypothetical protein
MAGNVDEFRAAGPRPSNNIQMGVWDRQLVVIAGRIGGIEPTEKGFSFLILTCENGGHVQQEDYIGAAMDMSRL